MVIMGDKVTLTPILSTFKKEGEFKTITYIYC